MGKIYDWSTTDADNDDADSDIKAKGNLDSIRNADDNDRAIMGASARFLADNNGTRDASTANTMTYTSAQTFSAYVDGMTFLIGGVTNTGAVTLNVDTLGAKDVKKYQGAAIEALEANDIITGQPMLLVYDGTQFILLNPGTTNGIANVVEDTTPQLGGQLDVNGNALGDGTNELVKFSEAGSAVNEITVGNAATGSGPTISATGGDTNIDLNLNAKGSGEVKAGGGSVARLATGSYTGDGTTSQGVTGLGFQPKHLMIWAYNDTKIGEDQGIVWTTNVFTPKQVQWVDSPSDFSTQDNNGIASLDSDGFTVDDNGADEHPNQNGVGYAFTAWG